MKTVLLALTIAGLTIFGSGIYVSLAEAISPRPTIEVIEGHVCLDWPNLS